MKKNIIILIYVIFILTLTGCSKSEKKMEFISIGTGGVTGIYYPAGGAIASMINKKQALYHIKASVESTSGSVFNINALMASNIDFGIVQSDRQYQAFIGLNEWKDKGEQTDLRALFSLHAETVTLVAAVDSGIKKIEDLKGKRVNIGDPGSGQRGNAIEILEAKGINYKTDFKAQGLKASESASMLQDGRIDAFFYTIGHPAGALMEASAGKRKIRFIPIEGMESLLKKSPYYAKAIIPHELYPNAINDKDIPTIGVVTTFVSSKKVDEDIVYTVVKEVFENLKEFKTLHPAFKFLKKEDMIKNGNTAPYHKGALRYFKETGLLKD